MKSPSPANPVAMERIRAESKPPPAKPLLDALILVVEDEILVAMDIQSMLEDDGAQIVGPAHTVAHALMLATNPNVSAAILDFRLGQLTAKPVARLLKERGVPFLFYTAQGNTAPLKSEWPGVKILAKPASARELVEAVAALCR